MSTAVIVLAAGSSSRLGQPKQLLPYEGQTLLRRAVETAVAAADGGPVIVVTGALHTELLPELAGLPVHAIWCPTWALGMGASLKTGLALLESICSTWATVLVMLCDQPHITPALLQELVTTYSHTGQPIVATQYGTIRGVPVLFGAEVLPLLRDIADAAGAAQLLKHHPQLVASVPFANAAIDVDTPQQYAALLQGKPMPEIE
ncbi:nucleotidyltransferase family protein [Hymenobacter tibetensis]|uniref:Nucleotidyltransferase family protein n=1 Tax=Hymenobacter tibetensis TaxID=497967 RepID=A0ABY4D305_9BACT|nr:nucleotidyltransferase family protein [Hymenobacter tibetensis]UOG76592.1 nucleotidyltransferase family protein [Hymenobacter tibetensis]